MARTLADDRSPRVIAREQRAAEIREALAVGDTRAARNAAYQALRAAAEDHRKDSPADGMLADAEIAGWMAGVADTLPHHQAKRHRGAPKIPTPAELLAAYTRSYDRTQEEVPQ